MCVSVCLCTSVCVCVANFNKNLKFIAFKVGLHLKFDTFSTSDKNNTHTHTVKKSRVTKKKAH